MSMIKCPECGKEISDNALACPNCGYQLHKKKKGYLPLAIIGTILSVLEVFSNPVILILAVIFSRTSFMYYFHCVEFEKKETI